jgi:hypothetical protein
MYPLWRDRAATQPNVSPEILGHLADTYAQPITAEDVMAYLAAVMAHPAFTARFEADLVRPGLRVPLTAERALFTEAVALGHEVIWLMLRRGFRRPGGGPAEAGAASAEGQGAHHPGGRRDPRSPRAAARDDGLRPRDASAHDRQRICRERHARDVDL